MILIQECDEPGCATRDGVVDGYDGVAYCAVHRRTHQLADLKRARAEKMAWLESTHLKDVRQIDDCGARTKSARRSKPIKGLGVLRRNPKSGRAKVASCAKRKGPRETVKTFTLRAWRKPL